LISAIDPVATISIFKSLRVSEKLYMIIFGESTINDAVSIALARSAENVAFMAQNREVNYFTATTETIAHFLLYFFGSMIVGVI
jgi:NhaP-type Na+/H+ or K+/H+ antiporter